MRAKTIKTIYENIIGITAIFILVMLLLFLIYEGIEKDNKLRERYAQFQSMNCYAEYDIDGKATGKELCSEKGTLNLVEKK